MRNIIVANTKPIPIGRYGENEETTVQFSINAFFPDMPDADFGLVHQRHGDAAPYPCVISELNGFINWRIGSADVAKVGSGTAQLSAYKNGSISKTVIFTTETLNSLGMVDPPSPETAWVDEVLTAGTAAVNAAERASTYAERAQAVADNIDTIVSESLDEAKESGEFDGPPGATFTPSVSSDGTLSWTNDGGRPNPQPVNIKGPAYTLTEEDKAEIVADVVNEIPLVDPDAKTSAQTQPVGVDANGKLWTAPGGQGGATDYDQLSNRPSINGHTLTGDQTAAQLGLATPSDIPAVPVQSVNNKTGAVTLTAADVGAGTYSKPSGGIPKSDLASAVQTSLGKADSALQSVPSTYRTAAAQDTIDSGKVNTTDYSPEAKTVEMTQPVGKDSSGKLWTAPGSGGGELTLLESIETTEPVANIYKTFNPCKRVVLELTNLSQNNTSNTPVVLWITFNNNGYSAKKAISLHQTASTGVVYGTQYECISVIDTNVFGSLVSCEAFGKFGTGNGFLNGDTMKSSDVGNNISSVYMYLPSVSIAAGFKMNIWGELA